MLESYSAAQEEIRTLAQRMLKLVRQVAPVIFEDAGSFEC